MPQAQSKVRIVDQPKDALGQGRHVSGLEQETGSLVLEDLGESAHAAGSDGHPMDHSLQHDHPEWFIPTGHDQDVGQPVQLLDRLRWEPAGKAHPVAGGMKDGGQLSFPRFLGGF